MLTLGGGIVGDESLPIQIDLFLQMHLLQSRTHTKEADAGQMNVTSGGTITVVGMTAGVRF